VADEVQFESSGNDLIKFLSGRDLDWQFPKETEVRWPIPLNVDLPKEIEEEWPIPVKVEFPKHSEVRCTKPESTSTCRVAQPHDGLRSLGPKKEHVYAVKKPSNVRCSSKKRKS
ncbi:hypothetical protein Tco_1024935, partial [Tanacetum coccineum]